MEKTKAGEHLRKCVPMCPMFLTPEDIHNLCVICPGVEHACSMLKGQGSASCGSGPTAAEAHRRLRSWGSGS